MDFRMIQSKQKAIALFFLISFTLSESIPAYAAYKIMYNNKINESKKISFNKKLDSLNAIETKPFNDRFKFNTSAILKSSNNKRKIGGPTQPEMASFKSVDVNNMVNTFTGDFNYNIPLLDVGGYPINIFYDAGITPEQEASWVGLGWNINPGTINRNMRGVPDDFDGTDITTQTQAMKPNTTFGINLGVDVELAGIKKMDVSVGGNLGIEFNNYLGPAINYGIKGGLSFNIAKFATSEKKSGDSLKLKVGINGSANFSSRKGATFGLGSSLSANFQSKNHNLIGNFAASTSYNSRSGIRALTLSSGLNSKTNNENNFNTTLWSNNISFLKPTYIPSTRMLITNSAFTGHIQVGVAAFFAHASGEIEISKSISEIKLEDRVQKKPLYGYLYYEKANGATNAVLDMSRLGDKEVTPNTPIISAPQYTYDVFSISGEGTGGSIRAYRNDLGYVRDNFTKTRDLSWGIGAEISPPAQFGGNFNIVKTPTTIGDWENQNYLAINTPFKQAKGLYENVYFRNPNENTVLNENDYDGIGGADLVRFKLEGHGASPILTSKLQKIPKSGVSNNFSTTEFSARGLNESTRKKRTQVINFFTAKDAQNLALDKDIKSFKNTLSNENCLEFDKISRVSEYRKSNHISQINVLEADGKRYIYGVPVYNLIQKDFTFSVGGPVDIAKNMVTYSPKDTSAESDYLDKSVNNLKDGYIQITETPAYAHSFLLSGLLSPDYVDVTGDGITDDDLGNSVKFNYTKINEDFTWRSPHTKANIATFNDGSRTNRKDDKAMISYGVRESWYTHSIESKTMIAIFTLGNRKDGKGAINENGGINSNSNSLKKLERIDLYNKADIKLNGLGLTGAKPIKTVHFTYSYKLCKNTPDNAENNFDESGKLTLETIYFTFNGQDKANKNKYVFGYENLEKKRSLGNAYNNSIDNPDYDYNTSDRWGNYKPSTINPFSMSNLDYPYSAQGKNFKELIDNYSSAWCLKSILLPSGGQIEINYESDEYSFVQDKRASKMVQIGGFGQHYKNANGQDKFTGGFGHNQLYGVNGLNIRENNCVFIDVEEPCSSKEDVNKKYLQNYVGNHNQLAFKLMVEMPKGYEYLTSYGKIKDYGIYEGNSKKIWVELEMVNGVSPLALTAIEYLREQLPGQAYKGYDVSGETTFNQVIDMFKGLFSGLLASFSDPINYIRVMVPKSAQFTNLNNCFVRLTIPFESSNAVEYNAKFGGGRRVKSLLLRDNWNQMTGQFTSSYGQEYDYSTNELIDGKEIKISSGVASYEPSIGGEENPFVHMVQVANKIPLGPTSYGSIEMPFLDGFYQAPSVGYSKVTVRSTKRFKPNSTGVDNLKSHSGVGKQVTEFFTAKDYPTKSYYTTFDNETRLEAHEADTKKFFHKSSFDAKTLSQGFLVELNDMHGKTKAQASYPENDENSPINYTKYFYRNTGEKGFNEKFDFIEKQSNGEIKSNNLGIDIELMTDARQHTTKSSSFEIQAQIHMTPFFIVIPFMPFIWPVSGESEDTYRAVTTSKVVNYHSIVDSVVVVDKGSTVSTKNLVYDAETGQTLITRTNNEFKTPIFNVSYPAHWGYAGMGLAYNNIDAIYKNVNFIDGRIVSGINSNEIVKIFESGDEVYILNNGTAPSYCGGKFATQIPFSDFTNNNRLLWVLDINKDKSSLINSDAKSEDLYFLDAKGRPITWNGLDIKIVRSGKRNLTNAILQTVTTLSNPIKVELNGQKFLTIDNEKILNATALEFNEKWKNDRDVFKRIKYIYNPTLCKFNEVEDCNEDFEKSINPYVKGILGNFKTHKSQVLYSNRKNTIQENGKTSIYNEGYIDNYSNYWHFDVNKNLVNSNPSSIWTWNSQISLVNSRGQELETFNALNIYTSAQYGYGKNLPTAIANNSKKSESFYEGFEDARFNSDINKQKNIDCNFLNEHLNALDKNKITNNIQYGFAHTGKSMLKIEPTNLSNGYVIGKYKVQSSDNLSSKLNIVLEKSKYGNMINQGFEFIPYYNSYEFTQPQNKQYTITQGFDPQTDPPNLQTESNNIWGNPFGNQSISFNVNVLTGGKYNFIENPNFPQYAKSLIKSNFVPNKNEVPFEYDKFWGLPLGILAIPRSYSPSNFTLFQALDNNKLPSSLYPLELFPNTSIPKNIAFPSLHSFNSGSGNYGSGNIQSTILQNGLSNDFNVMGFNGRMFSQELALISQNQVNSANPGTIYYPDKLENHSINPGLTRQYFDVSVKQNYKFVLTHYNNEWHSNLLYGATSGFFNKPPNAAVLQLYDNDNKLIFSIDSFKTISFQNYSDSLFDNYDDNLNMNGGYQFQSQLSGNGNVYITYARDTTVTLCPGRYRIEMLSYQNDSTFNSTTPAYSGVGYTCTNPNLIGYKNDLNDESCDITKPLKVTDDKLNPTFKPFADKLMLLSAWVRQNIPQKDADGIHSYSQSGIKLSYYNGNTLIREETFYPKDNIIEGWQKVEEKFIIPTNATDFTVSLINNSNADNYWDDIRIHPFNANMKSYVYDPINLKLLAELDENNYAKFYEYDEEGTLIRNKVETKEGIKTIVETRSEKQKKIENIIQ